MTKTFVITSGKGGVGKTNISVNTAIELAQRNYRTCLFDADLGLANVNILLGIHPENTLDDYIFGDKKFDDIILRTKFGIDIIPGSSGIEKMANLGREEISNLVATFSQLVGYDFFLIDTSSGISRGVLSFCLASNETIIVITAEATSLTDAYGLLKVMANNQYTGTVKILVNKSPSVPQAKETYLRFKEVVNRHLNINIAPVGIILNDPNIEKSIMRQEPAQVLFPDSLASQCIKALVSNLVRSSSQDQQQGGNFGDFWQRYFNYVFLDLLPPESDENNHQAKKSFHLVTAETTGYSSPITPQIEAETAPENSPPFFQGDFNVDISRLTCPTSLLTTALDLQANGRLSEGMLLDIFSADPLLMAKALKMICGRDTTTSLPIRITSKVQLIKEAGTEMLTNILNNTVMQKASLQQQSIETIELATRFWYHSYQCALLAEEIATATAYPYPEEAFIAGLIHDIGRLALQTQHPEVYAQALDNFQHNKTLLEKERELFKKSHAEIGAEAFKEWGVDSLLVDAVKYHTEPLEKIETAFGLVKILFLASRLTQSPENETETGRLGKALFGIPVSGFQIMRERAKERTDKLATRFHIESVTKSSEQETVELENRFRHQALEYSLLQNALPSAPPSNELAGMIRTVLEAFNVLFGIHPAFCLLPDHQHMVLKAVEYPGCFGEGNLANIQFVLQWEKSLVVKSFLYTQLTIAIKEESCTTLPLADIQLLRSLRSQGLVCIPLFTGKETRGVLVIGISHKELGEIHTLEKKLVQFGVQAGKNLTHLTQHKGQ